MTARSERNNDAENTFFLDSSISSIAIMLLLLLQIFTVAFILIVHPFTSDRALSYLLDSAVRLCTSSAFLRRILVKKFGSNSRLIDIKCIRMYGVDSPPSEGTKEMLPFAKIDSCSLLWPLTGIVVGGFEFQCQLIAILFGDWRSQEPMARTTCTMSIHISISKNHLRRHGSVLIVERKANQLCLVFPPT